MSIVLIAVLIAGVFLWLERQVPPEARESSPEENSQTNPRAPDLAVTVIAEGLEISQDQHTVTFQSRFGPVEWIKPYTDHENVRLIQAGKKRLLIFAPAFVADCLETLEEIGHRYKKLAIDSGAERFELVPSLNAQPEWVSAICSMVQSEMEPV